MRADLPLDLLEDLRLAVDEAVAHLITAAVPAAMLECSFTQVDGDLVAEVRTSTLSDALPDVAGFGWKVLTSLVDSVDASAVDGQQVLTLRMRTVGS